MRWSIFIAFVLTCLGAFFYLEPQWDDLRIAASRPDVDSLVGGTSGPVGEESGKGEDDDVVLPLPPRAVALVDRISEIQGAEVGEMERLWEEVGDDEDLQSLILERWASLDALEALEKLPSYADRSHRMLVWKFWGRAEGEVALRAAHEEEGDAFSNVLVGFAEVAADEVLGLEQRGRVGDFQSEEVQEAIVRDLAKHSYERAMDFGRSIRPRSESSSLENLMFHWIKEEPVAAFEWMTRDRKIDWGYRLIDFGRNVATEHLAAVKSIVEEMPTGRKKKQLLLGLNDLEESGRKSFESMGYASRAEQETSHRFSELLKRACVARPSEYQSWLTDRRLNHLDSFKAELVRRVIQERWGGEDPAGLAKCLVSMREFDLVDVFERWLEVDEDVALSFPGSLGDMRSWEGRVSARQLIEAMGRKDVARAFGIYERYPDLLDP